MISNSNRIISNIDIALKKHRAGELFEAGELYSKILEENPTHPDALNLLGIISFETGKSLEAIELVNEAIKINPHVPDFYQNLGVILFDNGDHQKAIRAFRRAIQLKPDYTEALNNLGTVLLAQGNLDAAIDQFNRALQIKPNDANIHFNLANAQFEQNNIEESIESYQRAIALNPKHFEALNNMGTALQELNELDAAIERYQIAADLNPMCVDTYNNLGAVLNEKGQFDLAIEKCKQAIKIDPGCPKPYFNMGIALKGQGKLGGAIDQYRRAITFDPGYAEAHWNLALALLLKGNLEAGWDEYEWRFIKKGWERLYPYRHSIPRWDGTNFEGKRLLVHDEQGLGDTIQFVRFLPVLKALGGTVVFETRKPFLSLLQNFPGIDEIAERSPLGANAYGCDFYIPLLSLPGIFNTYLDSIPAKVPYIHADPIKFEFWQNRLQNSCFKIGIVWAGKPEHKNDHNRSIPLKNFAPLSSIKGVVVYGLQKGEAARQAENSTAQVIKNFGDKLEDFSDTAGLICNLDLLISVDTAVAHLAGAMGKPIWLLIPSVMQDWRWLLDRNDSPWYPNMTIYRQQKSGEWDTEIYQMATTLDRILQSLC